MVLLAWMPNAEVMDIAVNVPGVDVIVSAWEEQYAVPPYQVGDAWILQAQYEGRFVGWAGLRRAPAGTNAGRSANAGTGIETPGPQHIVALDASFADDAEMTALLARPKAGAAAPARPH